MTLNCVHLSRKDSQTQTHQVTGKVNVTGESPQLFINKNNFFLWDLKKKLELIP